MTTIVTADERVRVTTALKQLVKENPFFLPAKLAIAIGVTTAGLSSYLNGTSFPKGKNFGLVQDFVNKEREEQIRLWQSAILGSEQQTVFEVPRSATFEEKVLTALDDILNILTGDSEKIMKAVSDLPLTLNIHKNDELVTPEKAA